MFTQQGPGPFMYVTYSMTYEYSVLHVLYMYIIQAWTVQYVHASSLILFVVVVVASVQVLHRYRYCIFDHPEQVCSKTALLTVILIHTYSSITTVLYSYLYLHSRTVKYLVQVVQTPLVLPVLYYTVLYSSELHDSTLYEYHTVHVYSTVVLYLGYYNLFCCFCMTLRNLLWILCMYYSDIILYCIYYTVLLG